MKNSIVTFALIFVFLAVGAVQTFAQRVTFSESTDAAGNTVAKATYVGPFKRDLRIYEADVLGPVETCFENTQISIRQGADTSRTVWKWEFPSSTYEMKWIMAPESDDSCRILFLSTDQRLDPSDFAIWRKQTGPDGSSGSTWQGSLGLADWWVTAPLNPAPSPSPKP